MKKYTCVILFLLTVFTLFAQRRKATLPNELLEISGLTYTPDKNLWGINDSGNEPALYRINPRNGKILEKRVLPIPNIDWEELQYDGKGNLWIADIGNNVSKRKRLLFYRYNLQSKQIDSILFSYPDQKQFPPETEVARSFDCEAFVIANDSIHLFTKSRFLGNHYTKHYTLPIQPGKYIAYLQDSLYLPKRAVTGAALSRDGKTLVLIAYYVKKRQTWIPYTRGSAFFIHDYKGTNYLKGNIHAKRLPKIFVTRQYESIALRPGGQWLLANEGIFWQKPHIWKFRGKY